MYRGVSYFCDTEFAGGWAQPTHRDWIEAGDTWGPSPSESFSLFSFWLGRDSDTLLEWLVPMTKVPDWTFAYLEQD